MELCPHCRARLRGRTICRRCHTDLGLVLAVQRNAEQALQQARNALLAGDRVTAAKLAEEAAGLEASPFHCALAGFLGCLEERGEGESDC